MKGFVSGPGLIPAVWVASSGLPSVGPMFRLGQGQVRPTSLTDNRACPSTPPLTKRRPQPLWGAALRPQGAESLGRSPEGDTRYYERGGMRSTAKSTSGPNNTDPGYGETLCRGRAGETKRCCVNKKIGGGTIQKITGGGSTPTQSAFLGGFDLSSLDVRRLHRRPFASRGRPIPCAMPGLSYALAAFWRPRHRGTYRKPSAWLRERSMNPHKVYYG